MTVTSLQFRFSGKVARLLGRESVSSEIVALFELIKNSYDADARVVEITFQNVSKTGGTITVNDNGIGMTLEDYTDRWMIVGTESKEKNPMTKKGRRVVGEKGVGRFSTEKLAKKVTLISSPVDKEEKITLKINWEDYEKEGALFDQIKNAVIIENNQNEKNHGLEIILDGLRDEWKESKIKQLASEIGTLVLPESLTGVDKDFSVVINAPEYNIEQSPIQSSLLEKAPYRMTATTVNNEKLHCVIHHLKKRFERESHPFKIPATCGPVKFQLYFFPRDASGEHRWARYYENNLKGLQIDNLLEEYSGVRIYRDGFWIKPYGGRGNDWLEIDKMRVARRTRIGNNQVIGFVKITRDRNPEIKDTTTRESLIENEAFEHLKNIVEQAIKEFNYFREEEREDEKADQESITKDKQAINSLDVAQNLVKTANIPDDTKGHISEVLKTAKKKVKEYTSTTNLELEEKITALESQRGLVTLGLATSYIAHEVIKPLGDNIAIINRLITEYKNPNNSNMKNEAEQLTHNMIKLHHFMSFVKEYSSMISISIDESWSSSDVKISEAWDLVKDGFDEVLNDLKITAYFTTVPDSMAISINAVDFELVMTNLLTNSINALKKVKDHDRLIKVQAYLDNINFNLKFSDNGPGVDTENRNRIFEPLFTTFRTRDRKTHGTGLGLTIVKDVLERYDGTIELVQDGEYKPGATFLIKIPLSKTKVVV